MFSLMLSDVPSQLMCWSMYNIVRGVANIPRWYVDSTMALSVAPLMIAAVGGALGLDFGLENMEMLRISLVCCSFH